MSKLKIQKWIHARLHSRPETPLKCLSITSTNLSPWGCEETAYAVWDSRSGQWWALRFFLRAQRRVYHVCRSLTSLPTPLRKSSAYSGFSASSLSCMGLVHFGLNYFWCCMKMCLPAMQTVVSTRVRRWSDGEDRRLVIHWRKWTYKGRLRAKTQESKN